ncbi:cytochrome C oxidase subunit IV family protein [Agrobacterium radiobacter]|uniref:cytochrome C oxidase subunit IV family protein n=1 Tax=Agrobacterium radiobacter TaxID=362 RepID=UPI003F86711E
MTDRITLIWIGLMVATALSWVVGHESPTGSAIALATVLAISITKARFVGRDFMELNHAPVAMQIALDVWLGVVFVSLFSLYIL